MNGPIQNNCSGFNNFILLYGLIWFITFVTRLGNLLDFGQLFKALGHN